MVVRWLAPLLAFTSCQLVAGLDGERELGLDAAGAAATAGQAKVGMMPAGGEAATSPATAGTNALADAGNDDLGNSGGKPGAAGGGENATAGSPDPSGAAGAAPDNAVPLTTASCVDLEPQGCDSVDPCLTIPVTGGKFMMGRNEDGTRADYYPTGALDEAPEHPVTVSPYVLDKYEVTVARFRRFVDDYTVPKEGAGAHPKIFGSGWYADWNSELPADQAALRSLLGTRDPADNTDVASWTEQPGSGDCRPINTITWYLAFAFCIWDGGRLPTEAEWEFAAAGGAQERFFPWGSGDPKGRAVSGCAYSGSLSCTAGDVPRIGSLSPAGDGRFGHVDLAGSVGEFTRDAFNTAFYASRDGSGVDVANLAFYGTNLPISVRGGGAYTSGYGLRSVARRDFPISSRGVFYGMRCARNP